MEDNQLIILGTVFTAICNVLAVIFSVVAFRQIPVVGAAFVTAALCGTCLWADIKLAIYFINKLKSRKK